MTVTTDLLLEATDVAKTYGAVVALKSASLAVRPGEVHALMGANGAGKSTLVKILTGAVRPDGGTITVRGRPYVAHSPDQARRGGGRLGGAHSCPPSAVTSLGWPLLWSAGCGLQAVGASARRSLPRGAG